LFLTGSVRFWVKWLVMASNGRPFFGPTPLPGSLFMVQTPLPGSLFMVQTGAS